MFSLPGLLVILFIVLLLYGKQRLPELGASLGKAVKGFKRAVHEPDEIDITPSSKEHDDASGEPGEKGPKA